MKTITRLLHLAIFILWSGTVSAGPITYQFNMPAFTGGAFLGQTSILDVTVDNGNLSTANQSYLNTQITALMVDIAGTIFGGPTTSFEGSLAFITTDASSIPTLDLSTDFDARAVFSSGGFLIQVGTRDGSGPTQYFAQTPNDVGFIPNDIVVRGSIANQVPAPATLALFGLGLVGLGWSRRKKA